MHTSDRCSASGIFYLHSTELMDSTGVLNLSNWNLNHPHFSVSFSLLTREKDVPSDSVPHIICIKHILTEGCVSSQFLAMSFWAEGFVLNFTCAKTSARSSFSRNPKFRFSLEIHWFVKKIWWGLYLEISPLMLPKQLPARLSEWSCAHHFTTTRSHDPASLNLWVKRGDCHSNMTTSLLLLFQCDMDLDPEWLPAISTDIPVLVYFSPINGLINNQYYDVELSCICIFYLS